MKNYEVATLFFFSKIPFKLHFGPKITSKKGEQASFENMPFFSGHTPNPYLNLPLTTFPMT